MIDDTATFIDGPITPAQAESGAWVRPDALAAALGVDGRTIRRRVRAGRLERTELGGRVYVRRATTAPDPDPAEVSPGWQKDPAALAVIVREQLVRLERVSSELGAARARAEVLEAHRLEDVAHLERTRAHLEREQAQASTLAAHLETVRHSLELERARGGLLEALAASPWYAVRTRRRLRRELEDLRRTA